MSRSEEAHARVGQLATEEGESDVHMLATQVIELRQKFDDLKRKVTSMETELKRIQGPRRLS